MPPVGTPPADGSDEGRLYSQATVGAESVSCFSIKKNVALFAFITFLFISVSNGCYDDSHCSRYEVQSCCGGVCVLGRGCVGQFCSLNPHCHHNEICCAHKCVQGNNCLGQNCEFNSELDSDCASGESCCNRTCTSGSNCIGEPCSSDSDCQISENCCRGTCSKGDCDTKWIIIGLVVGVFIVCVCIVIIVVVNRRWRQQRRMAANITTNITTTVTTQEDGTEVLTEEITTSISGAPVTQSNPLYQPQGPPSDQPPPPNYTQSEQPPPYTATPTRESDGMYNAPHNSFSTAPGRKTAGVV